MCNLHTSKCFKLKWNRLEIDEPRTFMSGNESYKRLADTKIYIYHPYTTYDFVFGLEVR